MPSRAFRSRSSTTWSRSTAPGQGRQSSQDFLGALCTQPPSAVPQPPGESRAPPTLIGAVIEDVEGLLRGRSPLLVAKDEVDPLMQVGRHILGLLGVGRHQSVRGQLTPHRPHPAPPPWLSACPRSSPHQSLAVLLDEVLGRAGPRRQHHVAHLLVGQLEAAQVEAWPGGPGQRSRCAISTRFPGQAQPVCSAPPPRGLPAPRQLLPFWFSRKSGK